VARRSLRAIRENESRLRRFSFAVSARGALDLHPDQSEGPRRTFHREVAEAFAWGRNSSSAMASIAAIGLDRGCVVHLLPVTDLGDICAAMDDGGVPAS